MRMATPMAITAKSTRMIKLVTEYVMMMMMTTGARLCVTRILYCQAHDIFHKVCMQMSSKALQDASLLWLPAKRP